MSSKILFFFPFIVPLLTGLIYTPPVKQEVLQPLPEYATSSSSSTSETLPVIEPVVAPEVVQKPTPVTIEPLVLSTGSKDLTPAPKPVVQAKASPNIETRQFRLNSGKYVTGKFILDIVKGNPNGLKLWQAFNDKYGQVIADTAGISLFYENGSLKVDSVGVCSKKYMIGGDYRNCNYADLNSAGFDAGLKQINTFYQRKRIEKLSGIKCQIVNSKDRKDSCTAQYIGWLINPDNNIKIALDIYSEQGFTPWYGYKRAFKIK